MSLFRFGRQNDVGEVRSTYAMSQLGQQFGPFAVADTGRMVTTERALHDAAVWACVDLISSSVASLPVDVFRTDGNARIPVVPVPVVIAAPSTLVQPDVWRYQMAWSMATDGNVWGQVVSVDARNYPTAIELFNPSAVTNRRLVKGVPTVEVDGRTMEKFPNGDLWHAPGKMVPAGSWYALSPIAYGANEIDASLAVQAFGSRFYAASGHPSAIVYTDQSITAEDAQKIKAAWMKATQGGSREPAVFGSGWKYEAVQANPESAQLVESARLSAVQVARRWGVPPGMIYAAMSGESITYQNASQTDLHYLKHSLDRYLVRMEAALSALLPGQQTVRFNRDALLRSDTTTRYAAHEVALRNGWRTINEVRALEDEPPLETPDGGTDVVAD